MYLIIPQYLFQEVTRRKQCIIQQKNIIKLQNIKQVHGIHSTTNPTTKYVESLLSNQTIQIKLFIYQFIISLIIMQKKKIDNYTIYMDKKLGEGSFGKVYIGEQDKTHLKVAVKMLDKKSIDKDKYIKQALLSEIEILKILKSQNIVGFLDVMESANFYYVIQQFCDGGDLRALIKKRGKLPQKEATQILKQICNGFIQILKEGIIHRDLKPENLLINKGILKICDFGFSKKIHSQKFKNKTMVGTPLYMSIEILKGLPYTSKCDIWALGFIFYELLAGTTPWTANTEYELINSIENKPLNLKINVSKTTQDFLTKCLKTTQKDRICWDELLRHPIFGGCFEKYIQSSHQFQNKLKSIMNQIRVKINEQNINLQKLFKNMGYNKDTQLNFVHFQEFLKTIDSKLTPQQQRYIFQKLDTDDSDSISFEQLEQELSKHNINTKQNKFNIQKKKSYTLSEQDNSSSITNKNKQAETKMINSFVILSQKMTKSQITLQQVFDAYDINKDGDLTIKEFTRIMRKLDQSFTNEELQMGFQLVDFDKSGQITFQQFYLFFCKSLGIPPKNYMTMRNNESNLVNKNSSGITKKS